MGLDIGSKCQLAAKQTVPMGECTQVLGEGVRGKEAVCPCFCLKRLQETSGKEYKYYINTTSYCTSHACKLHSWLHQENELVVWGGSTQQTKLHIRMHHE